jgi:hypothetical protein
VPLRVFKVIDEAYEVGCDVYLNFRGDSPGRRTGFS